MANVSHISIRVLALVNEERSAYGLRSNEYARYHKHCSQKLHGLRQRTKLSHGKGREYKHTAPVAVADLTDLHLQLTLFEAERAWVYSEEMARSKDAEEDSKTRRRITSRFRRALSHSSELLTQALSLFVFSSGQSPRITALSLIEILIYHHSIFGRFLLRRDDYEASIPHLTLAKSLLTLLQNESTNTSRDQALYALYGDEIAPQIRFAAHNLGRKQAYDIDAVVHAYLTPNVRDTVLFQRSHSNDRESREGTASPHAVTLSYDALVQALTAERRGTSSAAGRSRLRQVVWEGKPVPIRNPELVDAFLKVQNVEAATFSDFPKVQTSDGENAKRTSEHAANRSRNKIASYDSVLQAWSDAESIARQLAESNVLAGTSQSSSGSQAGGRDIHFVLAYITYRRLSRRIERDLLLVDSLNPSGPGVSSGSRARVRALPKALIKQRERRAEREKRRQLAGSCKVRPTKAVNAVSEGNKDDSDPRVNPGLVKLYDTILQSLEQMRNLSIVDESVDLVPSVEARLAYAKAKRILYLSRTYNTLKQYAEALALMSKAHIYLRESSSFLSSYDPTNPSTAAEESYYPLTKDDVVRATEELQNEETKIKVEWFVVNGGTSAGSTANNTAGKKKPTFYDVAFNYIELPMDRLLQRASSTASASKPTPATISASKSAPPPPVEPAAKQAAQTTKKERRATKVEEQPPALEVKLVESGGFGGLGGILGGWWGRK